MQSDFFYRLSVDAWSKDYAGSPVEQTHSDLFHYSRGLKAPLVPLRIPWGEGRAFPADFIWIRGTICVVSPRLREVLTGFSGWTTYPTKVFARDKTQVDGYAGLAITGRCGRMTHNLSRIEDSERGPRYVGLQFDQETWDGSDIFYPILGIGPVITLPVLAALKHANVRNYRATLLEEAHYSTGMVDILVRDKKGPYGELPPDDTDTPKTTG